MVNLSNTIRLLTVMLALSCMACYFLFVQNIALKNDVKQLQGDLDSLEMMREHNASTGSLP